MLIRKLHMQVPQQIRFEPICLCIIFALLSGCDNSEGDDLDQFMKNASNDMHARIKPLPEVKAYIPLVYNADGQLSDPFQQRRMRASSSSQLQPDLTRPKEPLESFPLESLKYVGMLEKKGLKFGLIQVTDNSVQQIKVGNYVGQNFGRVTEISESTLKIKEIVQDEVTGDWIERDNTLELQENSSQR